MKVAIMQPYIFPYLGYFQLVQAVDKFVFYDDVNFKKRGWINRNKILIKGKEKLISFPCKKVSQNKLINEVKLNQETKDYRKIIATINQNYKKAPYFKNVFPLIENILKSEVETINELAQDSIIKISEFLNVKTEFLISSKISGDSRNLDKADRLIKITKDLGAKAYINMPGGKKLYDKTYFEQHDLKLNFLEPHLPKYDQDTDNFVNGLSIIDVLMFNKKSTVIENLNNYELL